MAKKTKSKSVKLAVGAGVAAVAAAVGVYFLTGERGRKNRAKINTELRQLKKQIVQEVKKVSNLNKAAYYEIVDRATGVYSKVKQIDAREIGRLASELKDYWHEVEQEIKKGAQKAKKKVLKRGAKIVKQGKKNTT